MQRKLSIGINFLLLSVASCQSRGHVQHVDLGEKPIAAEHSSTAVFELRHGIYGAIPQSLLNEASALLLDYLQKNNVNDSQPKPDTQSIGEGTLSSQAGQTRVEFCTKHLSLKATETKPTKLTLTIRTCGINIRTKNSRAALTLDSLPNNPLVLSIGSLALDDQGAERDIIVELDLSFDRKGEVTVNDIVTIAGFDQLVDSRNYEMDLNYSGFEANAGFLGERLHEIREQLLANILAGVRNFAEDALKNATEKAVSQATKKANDSRFLTGYGSFQAVLGIFELVGDVQPRALIGDARGLGVSAHVSASLGIKKSAKKLPCHITHLNAPPAEPQLDYNGARNLIFEDARFKTSPPDKGVLQTAFFLSESFINHQIWQVFGDQGHCQIDVPMPGGIRGIVTLDYDQPFKMTIDAPGTRFKSTVGAMLTTQFPSMQLTISREITGFFAAKGLTLETDLNGQAVIKIKDFRHSVLIKIQEGSSTLIPHPAIESLYEEGFREGVHAQIEMIEAYLNGWTGGIGIDVSTRRAHAVVNALLDLLYKATINRDAFAVTVSGWSTARIEDLTTDDHMLKLFVTLNHKEELFSEFNLKGDSGAPSAAADLSTIDVPRLIDAIDLTYDQMLQQIRQGSFFSKDWSCKLQVEEPIGIPVDAQRMTYVSYAVCGRQDAPEVELRWQFEGPPGPVPLHKRVVSYIRLRHLRPASVDKGLKMTAASLGAKKSRDEVLNKTSARFFWDLRHHFIATRGFCLFAVENCKKSPLSARLIELEIFKK